MMKQKADAFSSHGKLQRYLTDIVLAESISFKGAAWGSFKSQQSFLLAAFDGIIIHVFKCKLVFEAEVLEL